MKRRVIAVAVLCLLLSGCVKEKPVPPEVGLAQAQELNLWRAGAHLYLQEQFGRYQEAFRQARMNLAKVNGQFKWFRDYEPVQAEFAQLLRQGDELLRQLELEKQRRAQEILGQIKALQERLHLLDQFTLKVNEGRGSRRPLAQAEVLLGEAKILYEAKQYLSAQGKLKQAEVHLGHGERAIRPLLSRYSDPNQIRKWKGWAQETIEESRERAIYSVLVVKANRKLLLYKNGELLKAYPVGLGRNGWSDKLRAKDDATPEGKYKIIAKNPKSRYHRALLINYPNEEDRKEFHRAKRKGLIPSNATIGGSIEIHGGGDEGMTYGCISLDDTEMEELYQRVDIGTPVTIVGAVDERNIISSTWTNIRSRQE